MTSKAKNTDDIIDKVDKETNTNDEENLNVLCCIDNKTDIDNYNDIDKDTNDSKTSNDNDSKLDIDNHNDTDNDSDEDIKHSLGKDEYISVFKTKKESKLSDGREKRQLTVVF